MSWSFTSYERVAESMLKWSPTQAERRLLGRLRWSVTEKIHGANFCFILDVDPAHEGGVGVDEGSEWIRCARRKALLGEGEDFFGHRALVPILAGRLRALRDAVIGEEPEVVRVFVYGELFGGGYPHPEVSPVPGVQPVQTGVWYAPGVHFCAFDVAVEGEEGDSSHRYLDFEVALDLFARVDLFCVKPRFVGSLEEALEQPVAFETAIPAALGLPSLGLENLAEGVVIKPMRTVVLDGAGGQSRPLIKVKIPQFAEDERYSQAKPWERTVVEGDPLAVLEWEGLARINPNRVASALSKIGRLDPSAPEAVEVVSREVLADVLDALRDDHGEASARVAGEDRRLLVSVLMDAVEVEVRRALGVRGEGV